jgi:hypothetical protein
MNDLQVQVLRAERLNLIKSLANTADQIAAIDCEIEAIEMQFLEDDLIKAETDYMRRR